LVNSGVDDGDRVVAIVICQTSCNPVDLQQQPVQNKSNRFAASRRGQHFQGVVMPVRLKKFIGIILIVVLVMLYALLATTIATLTLAQSPWWVHLLYFLLTGVLWVVPAMFIIKWMAGPVQKNRV
jgi:uncharacterized membrane protein